MGSDFTKKVSDNEMVCHTTISDDAAIIFGHKNSQTRKFIDYCVENMPKVSPDPNIVVGFNGYWDKIGDITAPRFGQTKDEYGRLMFFLDELVIMQRYTTADTLIVYNRDKPWKHEMAYQENADVWHQRAKVVVNKESGLLGL